MGACVSLESPLHSNSLKDELKRKKVMEGIRLSNELKKYLQMKVKNKKNVERAIESCYEPMIVRKYKSGDTITSLEQKRDDSFYGTIMSSSEVPLQTSLFVVVKGAIDRIDGNGQVIATASTTEREKAVCLNDDAFCYPNRGASCVAIKCHRDAEVFILSRKKFDKIVGALVQDEEDSLAIQALDMSVDYRRSEGVSSKKCRKDCLCDKCLQECMKKAPPAPSALPAPPAPPALPSNSMKSSNLPMQSSQKGRVGTTSKSSKSSHKSNSSVTGDATASETTSVTSRSRSNSESSNSKSQKKNRKMKSADGALRRKSIKELEEDTEVIVEQPSILKILTFGLLV